MSRITYSNTTIFGKMTAETVNRILISTSNLQRLKNTMDSAVGSPAVWSKLESGDFGVGTGQGEAFYNTIVSLMASMQAIPAFTINSLDMGG